MTERQRRIRINFAAFLLLFFVSLYRQISLRYLPNDPFRTYVLYACYVFLIAVWAASIHARVTQKGMRNYLLLEAAVMLLGLTIRFLQDTFWQENVLLMRVSGLCVGATLLPMVLLGLYASLGTGQADSYRISKKWYILLIPIFIMTYLSVTDEKRHFVCYIIPEEPQPNLDFHPSTGTFILVAIGLALILLRIFMIYRRNRAASVNRFLRFLIPFFEPLLMFVFSFEFFVVSLQLIPALAGKEVIELYAKIYYIEALTWEFYIYMGLVPVNTQYREIFEHATVGMQIVGDDGGRLSSKTAANVSPEQMEELKDKAYIVTEPGKELHAHKFSDGVLLWNKDVSGLQRTIDELNQSAETLAQEGVLLGEEIKTKNQEASLLSKNQIYDELAKEVQGQLRLMREITKKQRLTDQGDKRLRELILLGTYVKRRCNLRLIQKETDEIHGDDLRLSLEDMKSAMGLMGVHSELDWNPGKRFSSGFSLYLFDALESLLEYERFDVKELTIAAEQGRVRFLVVGGAKGAPIGTIPVIASEEYAIVYQDIPGGYMVSLSEGGV